MTKNYYKKYKKYKAKYQQLKGGEVIHYENQDEFYNLLNNENQPYIFLIGEGNVLATDSIYTELQDDMEGTNPFVNSFTNVHSQSRDLGDALNIFKAIPTKDDYGASLSVGFVNLQDRTIEKAYCLVAYNYSQCGEWRSDRRNGLPINFEDMEFKIRNNFSPSSQALPPEYNTLNYSEFRI